MNRETLFGLTQKADMVHGFRNRARIDGKIAEMTIHPTSKNGGHAYLFVPREKWDITDPHMRSLTCPVCLRILKFEELEEQGKTNQKMKV